jgi:hypothetical protein
MRNDIYHPNDRWWEVRDPKGELVCAVTVYTRGAAEVMRRLAA